MKFFPDQRPSFNARLTFILAMVALAGLPLQGQTAALSPRLISISTAHSALSLFAADDGRVYQLAYGASGREVQIPKQTPNRESEFYPQFGNGFILEPAIQVTHVDGNTSTDLAYGDLAGIQHETSPSDTNVSVTRIQIKDRYYPFYVTLCFRTYFNEDVIEQWSEINNDEAGPVTLYRFASASPMVNGKEYWLTQLDGEYSHEAALEEERLGKGVKILDSKIGVRASQYRNPSFLLALDGPAREESGEVYGGALEWSGSFQFSFEVDWHNQLRALCGINPFASQYRLASGQTFVTPAMLWTWSGKGKGQVSRNFHRWARRYGVRDGDKPRPVLLNNWEATGFKFDEPTLVSLFDGARDVGADIFLLDDGWFGNKHPRNNDKAGLGDWQANTSKLPHGLSYLADEAKKRGVRFGIWLEPEMVNPVSDLYEAHPEWAIAQPHREPQLSRHQLNLDLSRPAVKDFVCQVIDDTLGSNSGISYLKWDCNRYVTQPGSTYLAPDAQSELLIDYNFALYDVMAQMAKKYPQVTAMCCSGGPGRADYGALKYFHVFWPSDDTDPRDRVFIQWGFSQIFPACSMANHVTRMHHRPIKFALDVAMSGSLGLDMNLRKLSPEERKAVASGVAQYKQLRDVVLQGDLYRLDSPYNGPRAALDYVSADRSRAVLFVYQLKDAEAKAVRLDGLDPQRKYHLQEVNLPEGATSRLANNGQEIEGAALMRDGLTPSIQKEFESAVVELTAVP